MKFGLALPLLMHFACSYSPEFRTTRSPSRHDSGFKLQYMEKNQEASIDTASVVDMGAAVSQVSLEDDALLVQNLAFSLNIDDDFLKNEYQAWAKKYEKTTDTERFSNWKRNYLMQEVWNRNNGEIFDLNEYGDLTKVEFDKAQAQIENDDASHAYHFMEPGEVPQCVEEVPTTMPQQRQAEVQVKRRGGGFRSSAFAKRELPVAGSRFPVRQPQGDLSSNAAQGSHVVDNRKQFQKIRLFSGGYRIVPVGKNE